MFKFLYFKKN